ncbi:hypothetical protein Tco_0592895 [Tanacetum coccineum]
MDIFTKGALWDYWKLGNDKIEPTNEETSDLEETNHGDEQEIGEIFRIETNLFDYETPLCKKFKEFNYLLKTDPISLLKILRDSRLMTNTRMIGFMNGTRMYHGYTKNHGLTLEYGLNPIQLCIVRRWDGYAITDHDQEEREYKKEHNNEEICEMFNDHELPVCTIRRFEMIKYSFRQDEEYVAIKEDEYEDLMNTSKDACRAYQEIFRTMDEGWMDLERKEIDEVGEVSII